jgi:peptidoglycan/LPS O-acetylase OafA/YrhL
MTGPSSWRLACSALLNWMTMENGHRHARVLSSRELHRRRTPSGGFFIYSFSCVSLYSKCNYDLSISRQTPKSMKRILQLDGIRALAFLTIFCRHASGFPMLWAGVDIFFVLSGFLITTILMNGRGHEGAWSHFYERRALRILPPFTLTLVLATYLFRLHWGTNILWYLFFAMNFAEAFHMGQGGLGILWSLAVEEQFYLFWPLIALRQSPKNVKRVAITLIILAPLLRGATTHFFHDHWPIYYLMPFRMDLLASGAVLAVLWRQHGPLGAWRRCGFWMMGGGAIGFGILARLFQTFRAESNTVLFNVFGYSLICCIVTGLITFTLGTERGLWMRLMTAKPIRWIGMISYTGYLVHAGALGLVAPFNSHAQNVVLAFAVILIYASLSWILVERPILQLRPATWLGLRKKAVA